MSKLNDGNLEQVWRIYRLTELVDLVGALSAIDAEERAWLLRHHEEGDVTAEHEILMRGEVDAFLHAVGVLEVGFEAGALVDEQQRCQDEVIPLLRVPEMETYFKRHYPLVLPGRLVARMNDRPSARRSRQVPWFASLLSLDARFRDSQLEVFLMIVDGFYVDDVDFSVLREKAKSPRHIIRAVTRERKHRNALDHALAGLERFITFSSELEEQLVAAGEDENLKDAAFQLYRYWYAARRGALARVTRNAVMALSQEGETFADEHLADLERLFERAERTKGPW